ncbi:hypothetical protein [Herbiconiux sp. UC225_62]|uniref:hypothetical protein n=1 Tax=Herbiconiux sp. UC225_62 TaxID=3350168 RepID=UPI0036D323FB
MQQRRRWVGVVASTAALGALIVGWGVVAGVGGFGASAQEDVVHRKTNARPVEREADSSSAASGQTGSPADAAWPPAPTADPDPITITIPASWPEADKVIAREWVAVEQSTRACSLSRGVDYRFSPVWDERIDESGTTVGDPAPPADWESHFQRPFMYFLDTPVVCFNRALQAVGRPAQGALDFAPRSPRFEETDFVDPTTLDVPADWTDEQRAEARLSWSAELITRQCMSDAGFSEYGQTPYWLMTDALRAQDPWESVYPVEKREAARRALNGDDDNIPYDWERAGCWGRGQHEVALGG